MRNAIVITCVTISTQSRVGEAIAKRITNSHDSIEIDELIDAAVDKVFERTLKTSWYSGTSASGIRSISISERGRKRAGLFRGISWQGYRVHDSGQVPAHRTQLSARARSDSSLDLKPKKGLFPNAPTLDATLIAILTVYFVQGSLGIAQLTTSLFLKDDLGLSPADLTALTGLFGLPWIIKPVYGLATDRLPIFGLRRRPYLVGAGLLGCAGFTAFATAVNTPTQALAAAITYNLGIAFSDVVVDSLCVERARSEAEALSAGAADPKLQAQIEKDVSGTLQSLCWGARYGGGILTAAASGPLLEVLAPRQVYGLTALFPLLAAASGVFLKESPSSGANATLAASAVEQPQEADRKTLTEPVLEIWNVVKRKDVFLPLAVVVLFLATPSSSTALFYFFTKELGLGPTQLGKLQVLSSAASLAGVLLYRAFFAQRRTSTVIAFASIVGCLLGLLQILLVTHQNQLLGIPDDWLIYGDDVFLSALGELAFMPTLTLAARLCPPGQEGTFFALLMSAYNGAGILGSEISASVTQALGVTSTDFAMLPMLIVICNFANLAPLPFLKILDVDEPKNEGGKT